MPYVSRDEEGEISGMFEQPQEGYAEELLPDDDPEVAAFSDKSNALLAALQERLKNQELLSEGNPAQALFRRQVHELFEVFELGAGSDAVN